MRISANGPKPDWTALETAFEHNAPETHSYLDLRTGQVVTIVDSRPEDDEKRMLIRRSEGRFVHLDPASSREQYRWMERFVQSVADPTLRERLILAIDGKGAFRRFKDVLMAFPVDRERWFAFRSERLKTAMEAWLNAHGLRAVPRAEWTVPTPEAVKSVVEQQAADPARVVRRVVAEDHEPVLPEPYRELCALDSGKRLERRTGCAPATEQRQLARRGTCR